MFFFFFYLFYKSTQSHFLWTTTLNDLQQIVVGVVLCFEQYQKVCHKHSTNTRSSDQFQHIRHLTFPTKYLTSKDIFRVLSDMFLGAFPYLYPGHTQKLCYKCCFPNVILHLGM